MKRLRTLRARFALWTAGLLLAALLLFGLFVYTYMARSLRAIVDDTLTSAVTQLSDEGMRGGLLILEDLVDDPQYTQLNQQSFSVRLLDENGEPLQAYGPYKTWPLLNKQTIVLDQTGEFATITDPASQEFVRVLTTIIKHENEPLRILQVALTLRNVQRTLNLMLAALAIGVPIMVLVAGSGGYFLAAQALNPVDKVTRTARQISATDLSARLNLPSTDDEVGRLVATFDSMLARLDEAFGRERQFTADASHELRTPLAAMQTIISSTLTRQRTPEVYEEALTDLRHEVEYMKSLTEGLLILARNDTIHESAQIEQVDLALLLKDVLDSLRPLAEDKGLVLIDEVPAEALMLKGNRDGLIRLFVNLVDNAIKYTQQGSITISTVIQANSIQANQSINVIVQDTGVGIAAEHFPHLFNRFYRADSSRSSEGIGLGLAIAQNIARLHGGEITVESEPGKGTTFVVSLALAQPTLLLAR